MTTSRPRTPRLPRGLASGAVSTALILALTACSGSTAEGSANGGGDGLPVGASMADYQAAFESVEPITLNAQTASPKGSLAQRNHEKYFESITEWSGGKIQFEIAYSNAVAGATDIDNALADGRLDLASPIPAYEPEVYPVTSMFVDATLLGSKSPVVGTLQSTGWMNDSAANSDALIQEYADEGMHFLGFHNNGGQALICTDEMTSLDQMDNTQVAANGKMAVLQTTGLGMAPASVPYTEMYESLQRGVIECGLTNLNAAGIVNLYEPAPKVTLDSTVGFSFNPSPIAFSKDRWEELPLVAQQLIFDRLDVFLTTTINDNWEIYQTAADKIRGYGGNIFEMQDDARKALRETNDSAMAVLGEDRDVEDPKALVENMKANSDKWTLIADEMGYKDEGGYANFKAAGLESSEYVEKIMKDALSKHRPS